MMMVLTGWLTLLMDYCYHHQVITKMQGRAYFACYLGIMMPREGGRVKAGYKTY